VSVTGLTHRQSEILTFGRVMVEDLARRFEVSAQTIRTSSAPSRRM
jgi:DeoR family transcriptional regulator, glycerol-3-phosphate regulon repressor